MCGRVIRSDPATHTDLLPPKTGSGQTRPDLKYSLDCYSIKIFFPTFAHSHSHSHSHTLLYLLTHPLTHSRSLSHTYPHSLSLLKRRLASSSSFLFFSFLSISHFSPHSFLIPHPSNNRIVPHSQKATLYSPVNDITHPSPSLSLSPLCQIKKRS